MSSFIPTLETRTSSILCRERKLRFIAGDFGSEKVRIGREFTAAIGFPYLVCSASPRSRDSSIRRNSRFSNRNKSVGSSASKPVSVFPGDIKLLRDLQEFISSTDLLPNQVPSTRELTSRGRQDLANAVRRRGEKALSQLLSNPNFLPDYGMLKQSKPDAVVATASKLEVSDSSNEIIKLEVVSSSGIRSQGSKDAPQTTDLVPQNMTGLLIPHFAAAVQKTTKISYQNDPATLDDPIEVSNPGFSSMNHGGRENKQGLLRKPDAAKHSEVTPAYIGDSDDEDDIELYTYEDSSDDDDGKWAKLKRIESFEESEERNAWPKAAMLRSKLTAFFDKPVEKSITRPGKKLEIVFDNIAKQRESEMFLHRERKDKDILSSVGADPTVEIARLSALLHAKEMENLRASRELEETKAMRALVRAKHSAELAQRKQLAVEQDLRLHAAEQALHSLRLTQVDWWGEGNQVELAGSFNGWQHHAYLLPGLSSRASQLPGIRGPLLWRIELWLYPGVYEIKFIVDGKWVLDDRRKIVQGHMGVTVHVPHSSSKI